MSGPKPFRFSLQIGTITSRRRWLDVVRRAEGAGFDMIVVPDHLGGCLGPLTALASAAAVTESVRLGTMVLNNDFHHPVILAREIGTLDLLSEGRVELGLGAGNAEPEYMSAGIPFEQAVIRVDRLEESVRLSRELLTGGPVTFRGRHYRVVDHSSEPRPAQPHVPMLVGGGGSRVLAVGARLADTVGFTGLGRTLADGQRHEPSAFAPDMVDDQVRHVRRVAGSRLESVELQALVQAVVVTKHPRSAAEELSATRLSTLSTAEVVETPYLMVGTTSSIAEQLWARRERWGLSHYTVRRDALGKIDPVIEELRGR